MVNTSRGPIIEEMALINALKTKIIAGSALDVFDVDPLDKTHALLKLNNVIVSPHMAYVTENTFRTFYDEMIEDIMAWMVGSPIRVINAY